MKKDTVKALGMLTLLATSCFPQGILPKVIVQPEKPTTPPQGQKLEAGEFNLYATNLDDRRIEGYVYIVGDVCTKDDMYGDPTQLLLAGDILSEGTTRRTPQTVLVEFNVTTNVQKKIPLKLSEKPFVAKGQLKPCR